MDDRQVPSFPEIVVQYEMECFIPSSEKKENFKAALSYNWSYGQSFGKRSMILFKWY